MDEKLVQEEAIEWLYEPVNATELTLGPPFQELLVK